MHPFDPKSRVAINIFSLRSFLLLAFVCNRLMIADKVQRCGPVAVLDPLGDVLRYGVLDGGLARSRQDYRPARWPTHPMG